MYIYVTLLLEDTIIIVCNVLYTYLNISRYSHMHMIY